MINYRRYQLENGLRVILHHDESTPLVAVNILYDVGSKDESPERTGFAHLFEHLMFGGSKHAPSYDEPIQLAGGENNAYTNSDLTNFFSILPADNLDIALWLEADRMQYLTLDQQALELQKRVVIEEFKETCLDQPYGDVWHHLGRLAYLDHHYKWPTIGVEPGHVEQARLEEVNTFYQQFFGPNNAILVVGGRLPDNTTDRIEQWFGHIPSRPRPQRNIPVEGIQAEKRTHEQLAEVPSDALFMAFHMPERVHRDYYVLDFISDLLANGRSSRLFSHLLKEKKMCSAIDAYVTGTTDPGLFIIDAQPSNGVDIRDIETAIWTEIGQLQAGKIRESELDKLKQKLESSISFSNVSLLNRVMNLAFFELLGKPDLINSEEEIYHSVTIHDMTRVAQEIFRPSNCSVLLYRNANDIK